MSKLSKAFPLSFLFFFSFLSLLLLLLLSLQTDDVMNKPWMTLKDILYQTFKVGE